MKEGYLQLKISELNDKCTQIEQRLSFEDSKLQLLQEKVGEYKEVIKKLQDIQDFKTQTIKGIRDENEKIIKTHIEQVSRQLSETLKDLVSSKANTIQETAQMIQKQETTLTTQLATMDQLMKNIVFLMEHNELLMMKLVNKDVLSGNDVAEMERRAKKKAHETE
ncbi:MAG: hypothetical protein V1726_04410 [Methanobacteriota archaeon]